MGRLRDIGRNPWFQWAIFPMVNNAWPTARRLGAKKRGGQKVARAEYVRVFKVAVKDCRKKTKIPPMATYPKNPHELPEPVFRLMFPDDDPPIAINLERFAATAKSHVPLRKNSKLLKLESRGDVPTTSVQQHAPRAPQQDANQSATLPVSQTAPPDWHI